MSEVTPGRGEAIVLDSTGNDFQGTVNIVAATGVKLVDVNSLSVSGSSNQDWILQTGER